MAEHLLHPPRPLAAHSPQGLHSVQHQVAVFLAVLHQVEVCLELRHPAAACSEEQPQAAEDLVDLVQHQQLQASARLQVLAALVHQLLPLVDLVVDLVLHQLPLVSVQLQALASELRVLADSVWALLDNLKVGLVHLVVLHHPSAEWAEELKE